MWHIFIVAATLIGFISAQSGAPECPDPWVPEGNKCYLFSKDRLSWGDAKIFCEKQGAILISINTQVEHNFVQNWFTANDNIPDLRNQWYTSGYAKAGSPVDNPTFEWLDGQSFGSTVFWTDPETPKANTGSYVTYKYADTGVHEAQPGFFWVKDDGSVPRAFICEIAKVDADIINSKDRDFLFGVDNIHPDLVERGPYFVNQPSEKSYQISIDAGECTQDCPSVSFDCEARGYPQPSYRWFEDASTGTQEISSSSNVRMTITNGRLTIHNPLRDRDTSTYWCQATNVFGTITSEKARINFIVLDEFPKNNKDIPARAFDSATIPCDHDRREGITYSYTWFKDNDPTDWVNPVYNNHIFLSSSGSMYFSMVSKSDEANYHCTVSVAGGDESRSSPAYKLTVDTSPSYADVGPLIHNDFIKIIPSNPKKGDLVYLECFARFTRRTGEAAIYDWKRRDGRKLPEGSEMVDYNRKLIIHNVKPEDEGEYECTVSSQQSSDRKTATLSISAKPFFGEGGLENQHLDQGGNFRWVCLAGGKPPPTYRWLRNGAPFDSNTLPAASVNRISFSDNNKVVDFRGLNKELDPAMYQCAASNTHGTTYSTAQMRVLEFAPTFKKHPMLGKVLATEGGNATIACDPEAAPKAKITWLKDGQPFQVSQDSKSPRRLLPNDYLFLSSIQQSIDEGVYTCVATNNIVNPETGESTSSASASIELKVVQRSRLQYGPLDVEVLKGDSTRLECRADFNPVLDLVYLWYHNNRLIDFDDWKQAQIYTRGTNENRGDLYIKQITYEERGQYKCTVMTKSDSATLTAIVTVKGPPGEPAGIIAVNPGKHSVQLSWSAGAENGAPVIAYIVEQYNLDTKLWVLSKNVTSPAEISSRNCSLTGLYANTGYMFRIMAQNKYGVGVPSVPSDAIQTTKDRPQSYPENIQGGGGKEGTLVISWTPLPKEQWNAENVEYIVQYREASGSDTGRWSSCTNNGRAIRQGDPKVGRCVVTLGNDKFYTKYHIQVWARNSVGDGPKPDPVEGMSAVKVPVLTPTQIQVNPFNATALVAYWDPVPDNRDVTGGELMGFHIQYWKDGTKQSLGRRNTILGNVTEGMIIGLEPATDYLVTAQLFNSAGDAPPGRIIPQTTWFNAPLNMPEYVTLNKTSDNTIGVHFRGVVTGTMEEPLDGYKVRIWRQGESIRNAKDYDCGRRTWIMIEDSFETNAVYNLRVFGYSRGGVGKMSSPLIQYTIGCNTQINTEDSDSQWVFLCDNGVNAGSHMTFSLLSLLTTIVMCLV